MNSEQAVDILKTLKTIEDDFVIATRDLSVTISSKETFISFIQNIPENKGIFKLVKYNKRIPYIICHFESLVDPDVLNYVYTLVSDEKSTYLYCLVDVLEDENTLEVMDKVDFSKPKKHKVKRELREESDVVAEALSVIDTSNYDMDITEVMMETIGVDSVETLGKLKEIVNESMNGSSYDEEKLFTDLFKTDSNRLYVDFEMIENYIYESKTKDELCTNLTGLLAYLIETQIVYNDREKMETYNKACKLFKTYYLKLYEAYS